MLMTDPAVSIPEAFPPTDDVACFVLTLAWARNDVRYALEQSGRANTEDDLAFTFWVRVANGLVYEAVHAIKAWRQHSPEVAVFLRTLPVDAKGHLRQVASVEQKIGGKAFEHLRNRVFHYPHPDPPRGNASVEELRQVIADQDNVRYTLDETSERRIHYTFADPVAMGAAWGKHLPISDPGLKRQMELARDAGAAVSNLADDVVAAYAEATGVAPHVRRAAV